MSINKTIVFVKNMSKAYKFTTYIVKLEGCPGSTCRACMTLTFDLPKLNLQMGHLPMMENNCVKLFCNPSTIVEVLEWTNLDTCTHIHQTVVVTTSGLDKNNKSFSVY